MRDWRLMPFYLARAFGDAPVYKWLIAACLTVSEFLFGTEVLRNCAICAGGLMILDTITGMVAAMVQGIGWESGKFSRVLVKVLSYGSAIVVCALVPKAIPKMEWAHEISVSLAVGAIAATEALSVVENIDKMGFRSLGWLSRFLRGKLKEIDGARPFEGDNEPPK